MSVLAIFDYTVKPGRMGDFISILQQAADAKFNSASMPRSVRLYRRTVPGPEQNHLSLFLEYENMAAYGARTDFENQNAEWQGLFAEGENSPQELLGVELMTEVS